MSSGRVNLIEEVSGDVVYRYEEVTKVRTEEEDTVEGVVRETGHREVDRETGKKGGGEGGEGEKGGGGGEGTVGDVEGGDSWRELQSRR